MTSDLNRREMLRIAGATLATAALGCTPGDSSGRQLSTPTCVVRPGQTEGPYFLDEMLRRSDIRTEPTTGAVSEGVPLRLAFNVSRVDGQECTPVEGAVVDVWQCDAMGIYSGFRDMNGYFDTEGQTFLRGYQITDPEGRAEFLTIYPGWYRGRTVHIHFKVRTDPDADRGHEFTSQLYFDDALTARIHEQEPYSRNGLPPQNNAADGIYRRGGKDLLLDVNEGESGLAATFHVVLEMA